MGIYVAADAVQRIAGIEFFIDAARFLKACWRVICRIGRIVAFILASLFGASIPAAILIFMIWVMVGD